MFTAEYGTVAYDYLLSNPLADGGVSFSFLLGGADEITVTDEQMDDIAIAVQSAIQSVLTDLTSGTITRHKVETDTVTP
jgi:hypothetical protein